MINITLKSQILQRWNLIQYELISDLTVDTTITPKLEKLIHVLDWIDIEKLIPKQYFKLGRPSYNSAAFARAFIAKAVLNIDQTRQLIDRLYCDRALKRICGFEPFKHIPSEATFSRRFAEFSATRLASQLHEQVIQKYLGSSLIGNICRDATAIHAREKPIKKEVKQPPLSKKRGRPHKGEIREPAPESVISQQRNQSFEQMMSYIPQTCSKGTKCNAQGYKISWNGYKLHIDTADCGVPISAILSGAEVHDSQLAIPLSLMSQQRVESLYDVMDAAYCSEILRQHCIDLGHIPLIDHNPRKGEKIKFCPATEVHYQIRTTAERTNARLKDEFGGRSVWVKGAEKVYSHLMFGILALSIDQLMRLML